MSMTEIKSNKTRLQTTAVSRVPKAQNTKKTFWAFCLVSQVAQLVIGAAC